MSFLLAHDAVGWTRRLNDFETSALALECFWQSMPTTSSRMTRIVACLAITAIFAGKMEFDGGEDHGGA